MTQQLAARTMEVEEDDFEDLLKRSRNFLHRFPTRHNRLENICGASKDLQMQAMKFAKQTQLVFHPRFLELAKTFVQYKRQHGNTVEKALYMQLDSSQLSCRLTTMRPLTFTVGNEEEYLLRDGTKGFRVNRALAFEDIGTDREQHPLVLADYLSNDEMDLSPMIGISGPTFFINKGGWMNAGLMGVPGSFERAGVFMGIVGARIDQKNLMDWKHMIVTEEQNTSANGYGMMEAGATGMLQILAMFYGVDHFPTYHEAMQDLAQGGQRFVELEHNNALFDTWIYFSRSEMIAEMFLREANSRAAVAGAKAFCHIVPLGLGLSQVHEKQTQLQVDAYAAVVFRSSLPNVGELHFSWFGRNGVVASAAPLHDRDGNQIQIYFDRRSTADKLQEPAVGEKPWLLVAQYPLDCNSYVGNSYWCGHLNESGAAAASCSCIPELHNPYVNPRAFGTMPSCVSTSVESTAIMTLAQDEEVQALLPILAPREVESVRADAERVLDRPCVETVDVAGLLRPDEEEARDSEHEENLALVELKALAAQYIKQDVDSDAHAPLPEQKHMVGNPTTEQQSEIVRILLHDVNGEHLGELTVHIRTDTITLKRMIEELYEYPPICQKLVIGTSVLNDTDMLVAYHTGAQDSLAMTMVLSYDQLYQHLEDSRTNTRWHAAETLRQVAKKGDKRAIEAAIERAGHSNMFVRRVALQMVAHSADRGHEHATATLITYLHDTDDGVRYEAVVSLAQVAAKGDLKVASALIGLLGDRNSNVREEALRTLVQIAEFNNGLIKDGIISSLEQQTMFGVHDACAESHGKARAAAVRSLVEVTAQGDDRVVSSLINCLQDTHDVVRWEAVQALSHAAETSDANSICGIISCLTDQNYGVRRAAARSLALVAEKGNEIAIQGLLPSLGDADVLVRQAAVQSLGQLGKVADQTIIGKLVTSLEDPEHVVRWESVEALRLLAEKGDGLILSALMARLEDASSGVRLASVKALIQIALETDEKAVLSLSKLLEDADMSVRQEAFHGLTAAMRRGEPHALSIVQRRLRHPDNEMAAEMADGVLRSFESN